MRHSAVFTQSLGHERLARLHQIDEATRTRQGARLDRSQLTLLPPEHGQVVVLELFDACEQVALQPGCVPRRKLHGRGKRSIQQTSGYANACPRPSRGFTLVELLVVIGILALLMALILPAVQSAREASRMAKCLSNMKQLALACLSYESANGRYPPAGIGRYLPENFGAGSLVGHSVGMGPGWAVILMPQLEMQNVYDKLTLPEPVFFEYSAEPAYQNMVVQINSLADLDATSPANAHKLFNAQQSLNAAVGKLGGVAPDTLICPSSPVPASHARPGTSTALFLGHYAAIAGAANDPKNRWHTGSFGRAGYNGVLVPNGRIAPAHVADGTSKTLLFGEHTDWTIYESASADFAFGTKTSCRSSNLGGWAWAGQPWCGQSNPWPLPAGRNFSFNTTTIALPIGTKICPSGPPSSSLFALWNYHDAYAVDVPLQSPHGDGGTNAAFADGSVRYLPTGTDFAVTQSIAIRDNARTTGVSEVIDP